MNSNPYPNGARVKYDPSGAQDPQSPDAFVVSSTPQADGSYQYEIAVRSYDPVTRRPVYATPHPTGVLQSALFVPVPVPGPGNDL